jgi:MFS family permease
LFRQRPILLCFAYFCVLTIATIGITTFLGTSLNAAYGVPLAIAATAITAYLLGSASGVLVGGFLAARTTRHDRVAATGLAIGATLILLLALFAPLAAWAIPLLALTGLALGATGPSRDMIVRGATPKGASGRVYGFVYSGLDLGSSLAPVAMGAMLDHGSARLVAGAIAVFLFVAIATVVQVRHAARLGTAAAAVGD